MQRKLRVLHNQKCHDMDIGQLDNATTFNTFSFLFCLVTTWWQRALHAMDVHVHERRALECARKKQKTWNFYKNFVWFSISIFLEFFILSEPLEIFIWMLLLLFSSVLSQSYQKWTCCCCCCCYCCCLFFIRSSPHGIDQHTFYTYIRIATHV